MPWAARVRRQGRKLLPPKRRGPSEGDECRRALSGQNAENNNKQGGEAPQRSRERRTRRDARLELSLGISQHCDDVPGEAGCGEPQGARRGARDPGLRAAAEATSAADLQRTRLRAPKLRLERLRREAHRRRARWRRRRRRLILRLARCMARARSVGLASADSRQFRPPWAGSWRQTPAGVVSIWKLASTKVTGGFEHHWPLLSRGRPRWGTVKFGSVRPFARWLDQRCCVQTHGAFVRSSSKSNLCRINAELVST